MMTFSAALQSQSVVIECSTKRKATGVNSSDLRDIVVAHTGHSSQLVFDANDRTAQSLRTIDSVSLKPTSISRSLVQSVG